MSSNPQPLHSGEKEEPTSSRDDDPQRHLDVAGPSTAPPNRQDSADSEEPSSKKRKINGTSNTKELVHNYKVTVNEAIRKIQDIIDSATNALKDVTPFLNQLTGTSRQEITFTQEFLEKINALRRGENVQQVRPQEVPQHVPQHVEPEIQQDDRMNNQQNVPQEVLREVPQEVQADVELNVPQNPPQLIPDRNVSSAAQVRVIMYYQDKMHYRSTDRRTLIESVVKYLLFFSAAVKYWIRHLRRRRTLRRMYKFNDQLNPVHPISLLGFRGIENFLRHKIQFYQRNRLMQAFFSTILELAKSQVFRNAVIGDMNCLIDICNHSGRSSMQIDQDFWRDIYFYVKGMLECRLFEYMTFFNDELSVPTRSRDRVLTEIMDFQLNLRGTLNPFNDNFFERRLEFYEGDCFNNLQSAALLLYYNTLNELPDRDMVLDFDFAWLSQLTEEGLRQNECEYFRMIFRYHTSEFHNYFIQL